MLFRRKMFRKYNKRSFFKIKVICIISIVAVAVSMADNAIKEIVSPMAMKNAEMLINIEVNKAISELLETVSPQFNEYISEYYSNNSIKSIESDTLNINAFKAEAIGMIEKRLEKFNTITTPVQIGNIIDSSILSNRGPSINISYDLCCSVNAEIKSELESAGINQTHHIIKLYITTDAYLSIFCDETHTNVITDYIIGDTVIVGDNPSVYAYGK